ncbi:hypothetical protein [Yersinia phage fHe-Yen9-04]|uniref:Uncharacterized protein n=2 Tax=Eneladusvirus Yen904 TaxID=2560849 RepID=A0A2C9CY12_9CAUD|nr:hypothetical protein FDJ41_gp437 [Yersinia phage fHe-Yen9-04]SOK58743.1 hypothetical protein [Yersinia phage fHe-Yen9-04]SOK59278.1 hypothetical protein [Yersinia phage fHe-Yen9-03]VUE36512.1 hypothetical protein [Yersinia phage fHe-Yen9-04]
MSINKSLRDFILSSGNLNDGFIQRGKIHGKNVRSILDEAAKSGSTHLSGSKEERLSQLRKLRNDDLNNNGNSR